MYDFINVLVPTPAASKIGIRGFLCVDCMAPFVWKKDVFSVAVASNCHKMICAKCSNNYVTRVTK